MTDPLNILALDCGNSSVKASLYAGSRCVAARPLSPDDVEDIHAVPFPDAKIDAAVICAVGPMPGEAFLDAIRSRVGGRLLVVDHNTPVPIGVEYASPLTLGLDRLAAAAGAAAIFPGRPLLIADAGTALTLDIVDKTPAFRGGNISPGMRMRFKSLNLFTKSLPLVSPDGPLPKFGSDTATAIRAGVVGGMIAEIRQAAENARDLFNVADVVITGGDARFLVPLLNLPDSFHLSVADDLVGRGLVSIFNFNRL